MSLGRFGSSANKLPVHAGGSGSPSQGDLLTDAREQLLEGQESYGGLRVSIGKFTRDTTLVSGTQAVTGIGFKPSVVYLVGNQPSTLEASWGVDNASSRFVITRAPTVFESSTSYSIYDVESLGVTEYDGLISSMDADGFTVTWTKVGSPTGTYEVFYLALR